MTFTELAILINDIHARYFEIGPDTKLPLQVISSNPEVKTYHSHIMDAVRHRGISSVNVYRVDYRHKYVLGRFQRFGNSAEVWISSSLNPCWSRYVAAKEMSHLLVDTKPSSMTTDVNKIVTWMLRQGMMTNVDACLDSEHIAAQFAAELLVPYSLSQELLMEDSVSSYDIAKKFSVPERIIDVFRSNGYLEKRAEAYSIVAQ